MVFYFEAISLSPTEACGGEIMWYVHKKNWFSPWSKRWLHKWEEAEPLLPISHITPRHHYCQMGHCSVRTQVHFVDTKLKLAPPQLQLQTANYLHSLKMFHLSQLPFLLQNKYFHFWYFGSTFSNLLQWSVLYFYHIVQGPSLWEWHSYNITEEAFSLRFSLSGCEFKNKRNTAVYTLKPHFTNLDEDTSSNWPPELQLMISPSLSSICQQCWTAPFWSKTSP